MARFSEIIPVVKKDNVAFFIPEAVMPFAETSVAGENVQTGALLCGSVIPLLRISETEVGLRSGEFKREDCLDPALRLLTLYVQLEEGICAFHVGGMPQSAFLSASDKPLSVLRLKGDFPLRLHTDMMPDLAKHDLTVLISVQVEGEASLITGDVNVEGKGISLSRVLVRVDAASETFIEREDNVAQTLRRKIENAKLLGFDLKGRRVNYSV